MALLTPQAADALNDLLEAERVGVQCAAAFASGATEYVEREAFSLMGREDIEICLALRERLEQAAAPVSPATNAVAEAILAAERYDERLRAFAEHQRRVSRRAAELAGAIADDEARQILDRLAVLHDWHVEWAERRADDFAATRFWENGRKPREGRDASGSATGGRLEASEQPPGVDGHGGARG